jgi:adenylate cyclase
MIFSIIGAVLGSIAGYISTLMDSVDFNHTLSITIAGGILGFIVAIEVGVLEEFVWFPLSKKVGFAFFSALQFFIYLISIVFWLLIVLSTEHVINDGMTFFDGIELYVREEDFFRDIVFAGLTTMVLIIFGKLRMLNSGKDLLNLFTGKYYYPEKEVRIIMFVDLVGSTTFAERMGALKFSSFLKDCFTDISESISAWHGEVYQYVGDGLVVSWSNDPRNNLNALKCFFSMKRVLREKQEYYTINYDVTPSFRCGIHEGEVITTWVGDKKKELAFHGDTINTAARIQSMCKVYHKECLVSSELIKNISLPDHIKTEPIGEVTLVGKSNSLDLYTVYETT